MKKVLFRVAAIATFIGDPQPPVNNLRFLEKVLPVQDSRRLHGSGATALSGSL